MKNLSLEEMKAESRQLEFNCFMMEGSKELAYSYNATKNKLDKINTAIPGVEFDIVNSVNLLRGDVYDKPFFIHVPLSISDAAILDCIKELSEACWMNPHDEGEPMHYETYKLAWHDMQEAEKAELKHQEVDYLGDEWRNGDACEISGYCGEWVYGCDVPNSLTCIVFKRNSHMVIPKPRLSKPQTAEQKAAIEREEKLELYCKFVSDSLIDELAQMLIDLGAEIK
jgi:hypothetical protein